MPITSVMMTLYTGNVQVSKTFYKAGIGLEDNAVS